MHAQLLPNAVETVVDRYDLISEAEKNGVTAEITSKAVTILTQAAKSRLNGVKLKEDAASLLGDQPVHDDP